MFILHIDVLESFWTPFGPLWSILGSSLVSLDQLGAHIGLILASSWAHLGLFSTSLGMNFNYFGHLWAHLGASQHPLEHFELPWLHFYPPKDSFGAVGSQILTNVVPRRLICLYSMASESHNAIVILRMNTRDTHEYVSQTCST